MIQRLALLIGGLGAAGVLAVALGFGGFASADQSAATAAPADAQVADLGVVAPDTSANVNSPQDQQPPQVVIKKDIVYVAPTPKPKVVHVTRPTRNTPPTTTTPPTRTHPNVNPAPTVNHDPENEGEQESADTERGDHHDRDGGERGGESD